MRAREGALRAILLAIGWTGPALAQDRSPPDLPIVRIMARRVESLAQDPVVRRVSGARTGGELMDWVGPGDRYADSTTVQLATWMRDLFARLPINTCMNAAVDFGPSFPIRHIDSALAERYVDIVITARVLARVHGRPLNADTASEAALLAALLNPSSAAAIQDTQRLRRAFERRSPTEEEYCWFTQVAWARLAALPPAVAAPLIRRMIVRMNAA